MPTGAFNICCPRDCVSRHNGGNSGASLKPLRDDSALRALSGAPEVPPLCRETSVSRTANVVTVGKSWLRKRNCGQKWVNYGLPFCVSGQIQTIRRGFRLPRCEIRINFDFMTVLNLLKMNLEWVPSSPSLSPSVKPMYRLLSTFQWSQLDTIFCSTFCHQYLEVSSDLFRNSKYFSKNLHFFVLGTWNFGPVQSRICRPPPQKWPYIMKNHFYDFFFELWSILVKILNCFDLNNGP